MAPHTTPPGEYPCPDNDPAPVTNQVTARATATDNADLTADLSPTDAADQSARRNTRGDTRLDDITGYNRSRIRSGEWTHLNFPAHDDMRRLLGCRRSILRDALIQMERDGDLVRQAVPGTRGSPRLLPPPPDRDPYPATAAESIAQAITERILTGEWAGKNFPVLYDIRDEFRCSLRVASAAIHTLRDRGWVHLICVEHKDGGRGRQWQPIDVSPEGPEEVGHQIEQEIRDGVLTGRLPDRLMMAIRRRVHYGVVGRAYQRLQDDGVIGHGWLPDLSGKHWYVLSSPDTPPELIFCGTKGLALAVVLRRHVRDWLVRGPGQRWFRCRLPTASAIAAEFGTDYRSAERAVAVLARCGVVERGPLARVSYLPVPPASGAPADVRFDVADRKPGSKWTVCTHTGQWRPLPTADDDPLVAEIDRDLGYGRCRTDAE